MVTVTIDGNKCLVKSPYHPDFISGARKRNGKWESPYWVFDARDEIAIRSLCKDVYGVDGSEPKGSVSTCSVRLDCEKWGLRGPSWYGLGRLIVERKARDYSVKLGDDVVVISGGFPSCGGSVKNPHPHPNAGTILEVRDVPVDLVKRYAAEYEGVSIVDEQPATIPDNPLAKFSNDDLLAELKRRGV